MALNHLARLFHLYSHCVSLHCLEGCLSPVWFFKGAAPPPALCSASQGTQLSLCRRCLPFQLPTGFGKWGALAGDRKEGEKWGWNFISLWTPVGWPHPSLHQSYSSCKVAFAIHSSPWIRHISQFVGPLFLLGSRLAHPRSQPLSLSLFPYIHILVPSGCYHKNTIDWVVYKHQKFISHTLKPGKSTIKVLADLVSDDIDGWHLPVSSQDRGGKGALWGLFLKAQIPFVLPICGRQSYTTFRGKYRRMCLWLWHMGGTLKQDTHGIFQRTRLIIFTALN